MTKLTESDLVLAHIPNTRIVFHFNKAFLTDPTIPMWVVKAKGTTYYVNHLVSKIGFTTKETPDNPATKGAIQFKGSLTILEQGSTVTALVAGE